MNTRHAWKAVKVDGMFDKNDAKFVALMFTCSMKGKGKAVPLQAWSGPEGSRKLRFSDFMTTAQEGGKVVSLTHLPPLPSGNSFLLEAESTPGP